MSKQTVATARRKARVRRAIKKVANGRARLSVHRTGKQIYAQVIDDTKGLTLASASSLDKDIRADIKSGATVEAAAQIGKIGFVIAFARDQDSIRLAHRGDTFKGDMVRVAGANTD